MRLVTSRKNGTRGPDPDESSVFVAISFFQLHLTFGSGEQLPDHIGATRDIGLMSDIPVGECLQFLICVAHELLKRPIRLQKHSEWFRNDDSDRGVLEDRSPSLLARAELV